MMRINASFSIARVLVLTSFLFSPAFAQTPSISLSPSNSDTDYSVKTGGAEQLKLFRANYIAFRSGTDVGHAMLELKKLDEDEYELSYESNVSRYFLSDKRYETTRFMSTDSGLLPIDYHYKRTGTGPNKGLSLTFNRAQNKIQIDDYQTLDWNGELENQLFRIDFPQKLALGLNSAQYDFINYRGEKRQYILEVIETDNLSLPYGQITAVKVVIGRESSKRVTYAWFAPSLNYNLVRLQQFKDDKEQGDMQLSAFAYN